MFERKNYGRHVKICFEILGITYLFKNQNLILFEDNFCYQHILPFFAYCDFKTSSTKNDYVAMESDQLHRVFLAIIFPFCHDHNINTVIVEQSLCCYLNQLWVFYVPSKMVSLIDPVAAQQLRDVAIKARKLNIKLSISEMLQTLNLLTTICKSFFKNIWTKSKIPNKEKYKYEKNNLADWENGKYVTLIFLSGTNIKGSLVETDEITYLDFLLRKRNKYFWKVLEKNEIMRMRYK